MTDRPFMANGEAVSPIVRIMREHVKACPAPGRRVDAWRVNGDEWTCLGCGLVVHKTRVTL